MDGAIEVTATDYHTAGEPFRIVTGGGPVVRGDTVRDRRETARGSAEIDAVRRLLCHEPRGHADMYGCFLVPPDDDGADLGVLFWHKDGYSTACGHGTMALGVWAVETGLVGAKPDGDTDVVIDVPSGRVTARVTCRAGEVERVAFGSVPSYVLARDVPIATSRGDLLVDVSYGGAIYGSVRANDAGLAVAAEHYTELIGLGREVKATLEATDGARHPQDARLSGIYGTIIYDDLGETADGIRQRNVAVFADGQVDRSPCGSGTAARLALLAADGLVGGDRILVHDSIVDTTFRGRVVGETTAAGRPAVLPVVEGMAYRTGEHRFVLDPRDGLGTGFVLR
jgi:proline racemase